MSTSNNNTQCEYCKRSTHPAGAMSCAGCGAPLSTVQPVFLYDPNVVHDPSLLGKPSINVAIEAQREFNRVDHFVSYYLEQLQPAKNWYRNNIFNA